LTNNKKEMIMTKIDLAIVVLKILID